MSTSAKAETSIGALTIAECAADGDGSLEAAVPAETCNTGAESITPLAVQSVGDAHMYEFHIAFHISYSVPVLLFQARKPGDDCLGMMHPTYDPESVWLSNFCIWDI